MLLPEEARQPKLMAEALKALPKRALPSESAHSLRLEGLSNISAIVGDILDHRDMPHLSLIKE